MENNNKYLNIKSTTRSDGSEYYYAERFGKDSVAFVGIDYYADSILLINEYKPPINMFLPTAFGGSLDKNKPLNEIVREELFEEAGIKLDGDTWDLNIKYVGKSFVSTQMNQWCYLYLVDVSEADTILRTTQDNTELISSPIWIKKSAIKYLDDWKANMILIKAGLV